MVYGNGEAWCTPKQGFHLKRGCEVGRAEPEGLCPPLHPTVSAYPLLPRTIRIWGSQTSSSSKFNPRNCQQGDSTPSCRYGRFNTHPRGGVNRSWLLVWPTGGLRAGVGFDTGVESLSNQRVCGRAGFHPQNTYGETNWTLQQNIRILHRASSQGTTRIPAKFINTVHMQSL